MLLLDKLLFHDYLHDEERLVYTVHQHWWALYRPALKVSFFGIALPAIAVLMLPPAWMFFAAWATVGVLRFFYELVDWYFDVLLVTTDGVIDIDWRGFFSKTSHRIGFESIVGVHYEKEGFLATILDFGPLHISVEGHAEEHVGLPMADDPLAAEHHIHRAKEKYSRERGVEDERVLKDILSEMIAERIRAERDGGLSEML